MIQNMGIADRMIRAALAIALLVVGLGFVQGVIGLLLAAVAVVFLVTSATGFCPLYRLFGIGTRSLRSQSSH